MEVEVKNAILSKRTWLLNELLAMNGIKGINKVGTGPHTLYHDVGTKTYNSEYFGHMPNNMVIDEVSVESIIYTKPSKYTELVDSWYKVELNSSGKMEYTGIDICISQSASMVSKMLNRCGTSSIYVDEFNDLQMFNSAYFRVADGVIDVRPKIKKLMERI